MRGVRGLRGLAALKRDCGSTVDGAVVLWCCCDEARTRASGALTGGRETAERLSRVGYSCGCFAVGWVMPL